MDVILESLQYLLDPNWIMENGGLYLVLLILFIETGIIIGFFLPGDPLLFISGMVIASAHETPYRFGYKFKHIVNREEDTWFLKRRHIQTAHDFYEKKGGFAIAIARFLPIVRTFAPIIAGTVEMNFKKFAIYNVIGAIVWVGGITLLGYVLGNNLWVKNNLEFILIGLVIIVSAPVIIKLFIKKKINN